MNEYIQLFIMHKFRETLGIKTVFSPYFYWNLPLIPHQAFKVE